MSTKALPLLRTPEHTHSYKIQVLGRSGAGKTALVGALAGLHVADAHYDTPGQSVTRCLCERQGGQRFLLEFTDAGFLQLQRYGPLFQADQQYTHRLLVFALTAQDTFDHVTTLLQSGPCTIPTVVVGTRLDHVLSHQVLPEQLQQMARRFEVPVCTIDVHSPSATDGPELVLQQLLGLGADASQGAGSQ